MYRNDNYIVILYRFDIAKSPVITSQIYKVVLNPQNIFSYFSPALLRVGVFCAKNISFQLKLFKNSKYLFFITILSPAKAAF